MRGANTFDRVCLSLHPVRDLTFEILDLETSFLVRKVVDQGHRVKVKVTGAKSVSVCPVRGWSTFD